MPATRIRRIGTTKMLEPVGEGGMAEVFVAIQEPLQRKVAVKAIHPDLARNKEAVTRFRREALALGALHHENIVAVHDLVEKNGQLFMILEYVDGVDVLEIIRAANGPLPVDIALLVAEGVASALAHAHWRNVIHRDIKPANVMVSRHGEVKLTDFGIAKDLTIDDLTKTGFIVGTPSYLSPEQIAGKKADIRTDIYALGVLLFQCLSGQKPFVAEGHGELFASIVDGRRPRLRELVDVPRGVERIVDRCMQVKPERRYQRASDLHRDLERQLDRVLSGTPHGRMVRYLKELGLVREDELTGFDLTELWYEQDPSESIEIDEIELLGDGREVRPHPTLLQRIRGTLLTAIAVASLAVVGTLLAYYLAPKETSAFLHRMARWVDEASASASGATAVRPAAEGTGGPAAGKTGGATKGAPSPEGPSPAPPGERPEDARR
ncbi:MAG: serine/threonine protein kinase [Deltaproteobacteria bacterium]|nr:MAG: serine/threonine protein kinase [Deltaproteobacteria bacterium]